MQRNTPKFHDAQRGPAREEEEELRNIILLILFFVVTSGNHCSPSPRLIMNTPSSYRHTRQWYKAVPGWYAQGLLQGRVFLNCDLILFTFRITVYAIFVVLVFQHLCDQILALLLHQFAPFRLLLSGHCGVKREDYNQKSKKWTWRR